MPLSSDLYLISVNTMLWYLQFVRRLGCPNHPTQITRSTQPPAWRSVWRLRDASLLICLKAIPSVLYTNTVIQQQRMKLHLACDVTVFWTDAILVIKSYIYVVFHDKWTTRLPASCGKLLPTFPALKLKTQHFHPKLYSGDSQVTRIKQKNLNG